MDLHHETSRWKGMQISSGRVRLLKKRSQQKGDYQVCCYQTDSPEMLLVCPRSAINLSLLISSPLCAPGSHSSLYPHSRYLIEKYSMLLSFSTRASITTCQSRICCLRADSHKHAVAHQEELKQQVCTWEKQGQTDPHLTTWRVREIYCRFKCVWWR